MLIAQVNTVDVDDVLSRQGDLEAAMHDTIAARDLDLFLFLVTDILKRDSVAVALGDRTSAVERAYGVTLENNRALLAGFVSRKLPGHAGANGDARVVPVQLVLGGGWGWKGWYHHQSARSPVGPGQGGTVGGGPVGVRARDPGCISSSSLSVTTRALAGPVIVMSPR